MEEKPEKIKEEKSSNTNILEKTIDFFFSNDPRKWLVIILILGVALRFLVARNVSALGDEMVHGPHIIGFLHSGLISTFCHSPLWFYLSDIFMQILGVTMFSTRFASFFYGSLSILVIYLISARVFNKKIALLSAFLLAISYYLIRYTLMEMDITALFFLLMAIYLFIDSVEKDKFPYLAAVCIGLAGLIKTLSLFFVPAFLIAFYLLQHNKEKINRKEFFRISKKVIYFGLLVLLMFSPIIIHNILWYQDKGMVDVYVAQYFDVGNARQAYAGQLGYDSGLLTPRFFNGAISMSETIFKLDPIIIILGLLGLLMAYSVKEKRKYWLFLVGFNLSGFVFLILSNWLPTHYTTMIPIFCIFGAFFIDSASSKINELYKINKKTILTVFIIIILLFQFYMLMPHLTSKCALSQTRDYAINNMDKNSIVVVDSRVYRGRIAWLFNDFHYLEASYLSELLQLNENLSGQNMPIKLYFVECARDDCGWGTIKDQPEFNNSMEQLVQSFSKIPVEKTILGGGGYDEETGQPYFKIYQTQINIKPQLVSMVDSTHDWFYYPINYLPKDKIFDTYYVNGFINNLMYKFAWLITILSVLSALLLAVLPVIEIIKRKE